MWAAYALGRACSDCFEDFDLWDGMNHKQDAWAKLGRVLTHVPLKGPIRIACQPDTLQISLNQRD